MKYLTLTLALSLFFSCAKKQNQIPELLWSSEKGFVHPESIVWDTEQECYFVSNIGNNESDSMPDGFISKLSKNGTVVTLKFTDKIQSPKGLCLANNRLYVSALDELLEINSQTGRIIKRYTNEDVVFLNDVTSDFAGNIYVSGMRENAIYQLSKSGQFTTWYKNDSLEHPNGLLWKDENLFIGGWGNMDENENLKDTTSYLFSLNTSTKTLTKQTQTRIGKVDGIQNTKNGVMISSWKAGEIYSIAQKPELILKTETSVGDICFQEEQNIVLIPLNFQHKILAYQLKNEN